MERTHPDAQERAPMQITAAPLHKNKCIVRDKNGECCVPLCSGTNILRILSARMRRNDLNSHEEWIGCRVIGRKCNDFIWIEFCERRKEHHFFLGKILNCLLHLRSHRMRSYNNIIFFTCSSPYRPHIIEKRHVSAAETRHIYTCDQMFCPFLSEFAGTILHQLYLNNKIKDTEFKIYQISTHLWRLI